MKRDVEWKKKPSGAYTLPGIATVTKTGNNKWKTKWHGSGHITEHNTLTAARLLVDTATAAQGQAIRQLLERNARIVAVGGKPA